MQEKICTTCGAEFMMIADYDRCIHCKTNTLVNNDSK